MDDLLEVWEEFKKALGFDPLKNAGPKITLALALFTGLILAAASVYTVKTDEVGVVQRFGKFVRITEPGLHFKAPFIETVRKVAVTRIHKAEFGFRREDRTIPIRGRTGLQDESLMLTGDLNSVDVQWVVQYKISDPVKYIFRVANPEAIIRDLSEAVMREMVGDRSVDEVLTVGRREIAASAQVRLQELLTLYETGLSVVQVQPQDVNPPEPVKPSFNEVNEARQEKEKAINQAQEQYNKVIPRARGEGEKIINEARAYATERVNIARGEADRFLKTWRSYTAAKDVTRRRLYLEAMEEVLPMIEDKVIWDPKLKQVLPFLNVGGAK